MAKFIFLRDGNLTRRIEMARPLNPFVPGSGPLSGGMAAFDRVPPEPLVEVHEMSQGDVRDARRDPSVIGMARPMPMRLIEPFASAAEADPGPT